MTHRSHPFPTLDAFSSAESLSASQPVADNPARFVTHPSWGIRPSDPLKLSHESA
jgi:hypothetical protein